MRAKTSTWFDCKASVAKMQEDGTAKPITEQYLVEAFSCTEAEDTLAEELATLYPGGFEITSLKKINYSEIFFSDKDTDDYWYKAKLMYITIDEKTEKEKKSAVNHLVQAHSLSQAVGYIQDAMSGGMIDFTIHTLQETSYVDVIEHTKPSGKKNEKDDKPEYEQTEAAPAE